MSIELIGPQGYEYQYLVTAFIALLHLENKNSRLIVEKEGGEDAELTITNEGEEITVEIQVKSTLEDLKLEELTLWLSHFPDRSSENNLLDRLKDDNSRFALFVTRARGSDLVRPFLTNNISLNNNRINNEKLNDIIKHLKTSNEGKSQLKKERANHCAEQAAYFGTHRPTLREIAKRTLIWEQMNEESLTSKCFELMNKKYFVPYNNTASVLVEIVDLVKRARDERGDVIPIIRHFLDRFSGERIYLNPINVERAGMEELIKILETTNVLLLTGISFCGKTHVARRIARDYQNRGYNCLIESDLKEVTRFLLQTSEEERLCIIEDPFGQVDLEDNFYELWSSLTDLIAKLAPNRKIIVTSKIELLRRISNRNDPQTWLLHGSKWFDLTVNDHTFIKEVWEAYCSEKRVPLDVSKHVSNSLEELPKENLLQPGQLRYLAFQDEAALKQKSFEDLVEIATIDSERLGMYFNTKSGDFKKIMIALGMGASPTQPINIKELTYILSDSPTLPSIVILEDDIRVMNFSGKKTKPSFPSYDVATELPDWILEHLDDLETHGYITILNNNIMFSHPTYYEASKYLTNRQNRVGMRLIEDILSKGIACLESSTALSFAKKINKLFHNYSSHKDFENKLILHASKALNSIFPSVRDTAVIFLVTIIDHLNAELQKDVYEFIESEDIDDKRLLWQEGEPWIEITKTSSFIDWVSDMLNFQKDGEVESIAEKLVNPSQSQTVTSEEAWYVVSKGFLFEEEHKNVCLIRQLLSYKESFIREKAAIILVENFSEDNKDLVNILFEDEHPNVVYQSIRGAFSGWGNFSNETQSYLLTHIKKAISNKAVATTANRFMVDFGDEYGSDHIDWSNLSEVQKKELWKIWSEIFPLFLMSIPEKFVTINESDLFHTIINSLNKITSSEVVKIAEAWLAWIERHIPKRLLHESSYAVADFLLSKTNATQRQHLSERIIDQVDTNFITVTLADYIKHWDILSEGEKEKIILLLQSEREDLRWLRAVCLTRTNVPTKISSIILGDKNRNILKEDPTKIIDVYPPELLTDCLRVYIGHPQPLWWLGYHHARETIWPQVLLKLIEMPMHPSFMVALTNFVEKFINGDFQGDLRLRVLQMWKKLVTSKNEDLINLLYDKLEIICINYNYPDCKDLWIIFFENIDDEKKVYYLDKVAKDVEAFTYFNELYEVFGAELFQNGILPRLPADDVILKTIISSEEITESSIIQMVYNLVLKIYTKELPRLNLTNRIVEKFLKNLEENQKRELLENIEKSNTQIRVKGRKRKDKLDVDYVLDNWVSLYTLKKN